VGKTPRVGPGAGWAATTSAPLSAKGRLPAKPPPPAISTKGRDRTHNKNDGQCMGAYSRRRAYGPSRGCKTALREINIINLVLQKTKPLCRAARGFLLDKSRPRQSNFTRQHCRTSCGNKTPMTQTPVERDGRSTDPDGINGRLLVSEKRSTGFVYGPCWRGNLHSDLKISWHRATGRPSPPSLSTADVRSPGITRFFISNRPVATVSGRARTKSCTRQELHAVTRTYR